jgi:hypothetical protein
MFKNLSKRKIKMTVTLKSGKTVTFACSNFVIEKNGNDIVSLKVEDCPEYFYIRLDEIALIIKS